MSGLHKIAITAFVAIFIALAMPFNASGLGIAPAISEFPFTPGMEKTVTLKIINSQREDVSVFVSADGVLSEYITIESPEFDIESSMDYKKITYTIKLPEDIGSPGPHESRLLINTKPKQGSSKGTQISAKVVVYSIIRVFVPYPGEYAEVRLIAPDFEVGKKSFFGVEVNNLGTEDIFADSLINVLTPLNMKITSLKGDRKPVKSKEKELVSVGWSPENSGNYLAVSEVIYGRNFAKDEKAFSVGSPEIEIFNISAENFRLGGIAKFEIIIQSKWNGQINDVYADFVIQDESGRLYSKYTSEHITTSPLGVQIIPAYLETAELAEGKYQMKISLYYSGKKDVKTFDIDVRKDRISIMAAGQVVAAKNPENEPTEFEMLYSLFYVVIALVVVSNILIYRKLKGRNG